MSRVVGKTNSRWVRGAEIMVALGVAFAGMSSFAEAVGQETRGQATATEQTQVGASTNVQTGVHGGTIWGLTEAEYDRFEELMEGPRGNLSAPGITPIEVLGIEARSPAERDKYAELYVAMMLREADKALAFSRTVHAAFQREVGDRPVLDHGVLNRIRAASESRYDALPLGIEPRGRLMVFTEIDCKRCAKRIASALASAKTKFAGIDVYFVGATASDKKEIQTWARRHGITPTDMQGRRITLNLDQGEHEFVERRLKRSLPSSLAFAQRRGDSYEAVNGASL